MSYYEALGVGNKSTPKEIRKAYRKLAFQYHPDRNPGDSNAENKFKEIQVAYDVLGDPIKRQSYDAGKPSPSQYQQQYQYNPPQQQRRKPKPKPPKPKPKPPDPYVKTINRINISRKEIDDIICSFVDIHPGRGRGRGIVVHVPITHDERKNGCTKKVRIKKRVMCEVCYGIATKSTYSELPCCHCQQKGYIERTHRISMIRDRCKHCDGTGFQNLRCLICKGEGFIDYFAEEMEVIIPAETVIGSQVRIKEKGEAGRRSNGDIYITFIPAH